MTDTVPPAVNICDALGFTPGDAARAAARVQRRIDRIDTWESEQTSFTLPDDSRVHLYQYVIDTTSDVEYMIAAFDTEQIKLQEARPPGDASEQRTFGPAVWLTIGQFVRYADPQYTTDGAPRYAY